ncbi:uncharacterized protein LOC135162035 [Diachasmimorpha longicaudata]|uniref:uncharacterized protein LOC135162035 n=1 Tax=Diachasmimorpha longicaudata TaxID=58733 RepID=UPI0030B8EF1C
MNLLFIFIIIPECLSLIGSEEDENFVATGGNRRALVCKFGNHEYWLFKERKTWPEAVLQCEKEGTEIAEVREMDEAKRLAQIMMRNRPDAIESAWIGGYAKNKTRGITWRWISTNEEISKTILWREPQKIINNSSVRGCLLFDWHHWENPAFIEFPCDRRREYICQRMTNDGTVHPDPSSPAHKSTFNISPTTTPSTVTTSSAAAKFISTININFSSTSAELPSDDHDFTTVPLVTFIKRNKIRTTTEDYQERNDEDYYNYDEMDHLRLAISTREPLSPTTTQTESPLMVPPKDEGRIPMTRGNPVIFPPEPEPRNNVKPLKLYYAFEGPLVAALRENMTGGSNSHYGRRYQKYVAVTKTPLKTTLSQIRGRIFGG